MFSTGRSSDIWADFIEIVGLSSLFGISERYSMLMFISGLLGLNTFVMYS